MKYKKAKNNKKISSKKLSKIKNETDEIIRSKYGKTNKQIFVDNAIKRIGSATLQTAAAIGIISSGMIATSPALAATGAITISALGSMYRNANKISTVHKLVTNHSKITKANKHEKAREGYKYAKKMHVKKPDVIHY